MNKAVSLTLLVIGVVLLILGLNAGDSFASSVSEIFTGTPTKKAIILLVSGTLLTIVGLVGMVRGKTE